MARKDTIDVNASGKKITIKDVRASNMRADQSKEQIKKPKAYAEEVVGMFADDDDGSQKEFDAMASYFKKNDPEYSKAEKTAQKKMVEDILKATKGSKYGASLKTTEAKVVTKNQNGGTL
tara:strand:- start:2857 stop:3216 length:360 start_codon:yes stop_codon:yes gene_type:complete